MTAHKAYYSVIQYCPDLARMEAVNVGIAIFCPELRFLETKIASANERIKQFFGSQGHDWKRINLFKSGLAKRIDSQSREIRSREEFEHFVRLQANVMQLTIPKPCKVSDNPTEDLDRLFKQLVGTTKEPRRRKSLKGELKSLFERSGLLENKIVKDVKVEVPLFNRQIDVPYGYQNGRFNLITPVAFDGKKTSNLETTACRYAVEGESLYQSRNEKYGHLQLVVVGKFAEESQKAQQVVHNILGEHDVRLIPFSEVDNLVSEIETTGKNVE